MLWPFYLALRQLFPSGRWFPFFTVISILGVALGVALLVVSTSVMGGFGYQIRQMIVDTQGEVQLRAYGLLYEPETVLDEVERVPGVAAATPFAEGVAMLEFARKPAFPAVQGIDLERAEAVVPLRHFVRAGSLDALDDDSVILSAPLAQSLGVRLGSRIDLYSPLLLERLKGDQVVMPRELEVVGIFEIGHQQLDNALVLVTLRTMQELYGLGDAVHGINVKLAEGSDPDAVAARINTVLAAEGRPAQARSWLDANEDFLFVLQLEKNMIFFLLTFIIVVSAFSVASSLLIAVVRKTREIGLLGALGAQPVAVALCFCFQGFFIGVLGTGCGLGLGLTFLHFRNDVVRLFTELTGSEQVLARFYQFSQLPSHTARGDLVLIVICAVVISTLAGLLPAWRAARFKPVEALRAE
ncbi:ABC transporter permease [Cephaloticoccus primus]|uniref:ABC transporter permease n=1 Tax=Cephaloticoccus primus TaxID=1548207 RepID=A0A139SSH5_9BACT|nr:ABC transporter permease [Cephaloticoccus primus]KXU37452.1 ABC transporter permease [Cephaloticoccus primus]